MRSEHILILRSLWLDGVENGNLLSFFGLLFGYITHFFHDLDCILLSFNQGLIACCIIRVVDGWIIWDSSQEGGFSNGEILSRFAKISLRSRFDAITTTAIRTLVEVHGKNLLFVVHFF